VIHPEFSFALKPTALLTSLAVLALIAARARAATSVADAGASASELGELAKQIPNPVAALPLNKPKAAPVPASYQK
jgi:hypothetical protein